MVQLRDMAYEHQANGGLSRTRIVLGILLVSAGTLLAIALWKMFRGRSTDDDDASQLCRLVSPCRSKDDDKRVQLKRRHRPRSPKASNIFNELPPFRRQNTM